MRGTPSPVTEHTVDLSAEAPTRQEPLDDVTL